ncbi:hypothetical protein Pla108_31730 [Botrimarina colliarenosi]|uniref:PEP-CTERM protein-sorting domain-containing protein n=1 Tax=Botrimarina colliarenosi TaxID=2528001 RepID=A0A5C6AAL3_9BACT|nr:PEP-CTERM sorting domain-containing protein [Botrimarina colliarenosi]TWT96091.1 hypothetical protein Pla108_31730 [Botrimarina colliarenosi]
MTLRNVLPMLVAIFGMASAGNAGMINTIIGNFDIAFDGQTGEITDFNRPDGGNLLPAEARTFSSLEIEVDGISEEMLMNPPDALWGDLKITNLGAELATGSLQNNVGGSGNPTAYGFDYFDGNGNNLRIGIDDISYTVVQTGLPGLNFFNFFAEGKVISQSLPGGWEYGEDVLLSYSATEVMVLSGQTGVRSLVASGVMTITGNMIPEPSSLVMMVLGSAASCCFRRR